MSAVVAASGVVPVERTAIDALDPHAREIAITGYLAIARDRLSDALRETGPETVSSLRAETATVAEMVKQLGLSREIQEDAAEMVRRSEYGVGKAIRAGQDAGTIGSREHGGDRRSSSRLELEPKASPYDFAPHSVLYGDGREGGNGAYAMAEATEAEFDEAIDRAKQEHNLSRANVVRKVREVKSATEQRAEKWERIEALAARGCTSDQIAREVGMSRQGVVRGAERMGIDIRADRIVGRSRRIDTNRVIRETVTALEGLVSGLSLIDVADINDVEEAQTWVDSLTQSISAIRRATNQIKESIS